MLDARCSSSFISRTKGEDLTHFRCVKSLYITPLSGIWHIIGLKCKFAKAPDVFFSCNPLNRRCNVINALTVICCDALSCQTIKWINFRYFFFFKFIKSTILIWKQDHLPQSPETANKIQLLIQLSPMTKFILKRNRLFTANYMFRCSSEARRLLAWLNLSLQRRAGVDCKEQRAAICKELGQHFSARHPSPPTSPFFHHYRLISLV